MLQVVIHDNKMSNCSILHTLNFLQGIDSIDKENNAQRNVLYTGGTLCNLEFVTDDSL